MDISVIIPLYKGNKYCKRLLNLMNVNLLFADLYNYCNVEVIFINDYPDEEISLEEQNTLYKVHVVTHPINKGIHAARVTGIQHAAGEYIMMLDQDDLVEEDWIYSQWNKIKKEQANYCVCNGWLRRFQVIWEKKEFESKVNDLNYYFETSNTILSPGQVIIKKEAIPKEWFYNIQKVNGADDFLLWILALKKGYVFSVNDKCLYYHTPERNQDSVSSSQMTKSLEETLYILKTAGVCSQKEQEQLRNQIEKCKEIKNTYSKFEKMFDIMYRWSKLRNHDILVGNYLKAAGYAQIAIYGIGYIGECLYEELKRTEITILYGIDRRANDHEHQLTIYHIEDELPKVDAVIITVAEGGKELKKVVREKIDTVVLTFDEILMGMENSLISCGFEEKDYEDISDCTNL